MQLKLIKTLFFKLKNSLRIILAMLEDLIMIELLKNKLKLKI